MLLVLLGVLVALLRVLRLLLVVLLLRRRSAVAVCEEAGAVCQRGVSSEAIWRSGEVSSLCGGGPPYPPCCWLLYCG